MQKVFAVVLVALLAIPTSALAEQKDDGSRAEPGFSVLDSAQIEATKLGRSLDNARAQETKADAWDQLQKVPIGTRVRVTLTSGAELESELVEARVDAIVIENSQLIKGQFRAPTGTPLRDRLTLKRSEVVTVAVSAPPRRTPVGAKIALWAGLGVVLVIVIRWAISNSLS